MTDAAYLELLASYESAHCGRSFCTSEQHRQLFTYRCPMDGVLVHPAE